jgi:hypothetical protein
MWEIIRTLLIWGGIAAVVFCLLWPAMWVEPLESLRKMGAPIFSHVGSTHRKPIFFNGEVTTNDPGLQLYVATIGWRTTMVTLPMILVALGYGLFRARRNRLGPLIWLLVAYVFFFSLQMGLSAHKASRYLLPVFPVLDVIAAIGLVQIAKGVGRVRWAPAGLIGSLLAFQALISLTRHPYYGTHNNALLGGSKVAQRVFALQEQLEGLDLAAHYLNTLPRAERARTAIHRRGGNLFRSISVGMTTTFDDPQVDYRVYFIHHMVRDLQSEEWEDAWHADQGTEPLWTWEFDGIPYVWIYGSAPKELAAGGPEYPVEHQLGEQIWLNKVRLSADTLAPGEVLTVVPHWESDGEVGRSYKVFCHLLSVDGELVAQRDGLPLDGIRPTSTWLVGEVIEDSYEIALDNEMAAGEYELSVGMYDAETMARLPVYDAAGERQLDDRIVIGMVRVGTPTEE